jgi:hypothetical protein
MQYLLVESAFTKGRVWLPPSYLQFTIFYSSRTSVYHLYFQFLKDLPPSLIKIALNTLLELAKVRRKWNYAQVELCASGIMLK